MDDLELQRILAETMQESSFGEDTEQVGGNLPEEIEVTVEDLVFTLRQIATAVIEVRDKVDLQTAKLEQLQDLVTELQQPSPPVHEAEDLASLKQSLLEAQAENQQAVLTQVKAMGSVLAEIASGGQPVPTASDEDEQCNSQEAADGNRVSKVDTAKRRSDHRKLTFTARLRRKMLDEKADQLQANPAPPETKAAEEKAPAAPPPAKKPAIRRPDDAARVPAAPSEKAEASTSDDDSAEPDPSAPQDDGGPRNTGDVPVPTIVKQVQKQVFNFKLAVSQIVRANELPRLGTPLSNDVASLLTEMSNTILKKSLDLHNQNLALAQASFTSQPAAGDQEPERFWNEEMIDEYRQFRTTWFIKHILDKAEIHIRKAGLDDHLLLLDELAMELDLGRIAVQEGAPFETKRHQVKEGTQQPMGGDFYNIVVNQLYKPGYVDLSTGKTIRKAIVSVKMVPR